MRTSHSTFNVVSVVCALVWLFSPALAQDEAPGHIIVFKGDVDPRVAAKQLASQHGLQLGRIYQHAIRGAFVPTDLPPRALEALRSNPNVAYVEKNQVCSGVAQSISTGIDRVDVENAVAIDGIADLVDVDIAIIDSGVDSTHPDLRVNHSMSVAYYFTYEGKRRKRTAIFNESYEESQWTDQHGHGSHVAGIAAAMDNGIGVVGVAPGARVASVRVLDANNRGTSSTLLAGFDYVTAHADVFEVANISIQGGYSQSSNDAIRNMTDAGVVAVVCAGNFARDAATTSPASAPSAITVSALADSDGLPGGLGPDTAAGSDGITRGADDTLATFSNFGEVIDVAAPGVDIYSTHWQNGYATMSGTSMATPHVAGAVALHIALNGRDRDGNGVVDGNDVALMELLVRSTGWQAGDPEYFGGDPDVYPEPLLNVANLIGHDIDQEPTVLVTAPTDGAVVSGAVSLEAIASDDYAVSQVEFFVGDDSAGLGIPSAGAYSLAWDSTSVSDGTYEIRAVATDDSLQTSSSFLFVAVDNVDSPPAADAGPDQSVEDTDGSGGESIALDGSGSSDDRGISSYQWYENGSLLATGVAPTVDLPVGTHVITLVVQDLVGLTAEDSVVITVEEGPPPGTAVLVESVTITGYGGKNSDNHLQVVADIRNNSGVAVAGAVVEADLYRDGNMISASTSTTDASGVASLFDEKSVAAGCYSVVITAITAPGLSFEGGTPENEYCK